MLVQAAEDVPFPDVPPAVLQQSTVAAQAAEMREWFKAWRDQDHSVRDYRPYFRPVLCYMEGMWVHAQETLDETFESDRHFLAAATWPELLQQARFSAHAGVKSNAENWAYLPRLLLNVSDDGVPTFAQWIYNILCQPISGDLPLDRLRVVDDVSARMRFRMNKVEYSNMAMARFQLNAVNETWGDDSATPADFLDQLMAQIPGKNGPTGNIEDYGIGVTKLKDGDDSNRPLNSAFYHRKYGFDLPGASGRRVQYRGYSDNNLYVAQTDKPEVVAFNVSLGNRHISQKFSYAIPLEIIYLTPISPLSLSSVAYL